MEDCNHRLGFGAEHYDLPGTGYVYILRCAKCHDVVGIIPDLSRLRNQLDEIQKTVRGIEAKVMYLK
jgi:hypothetical protein